MPELPTEYFDLGGGAKMPRIGFGTWQAPESELEPAVDAALAAGYRHFDSAAVYENEGALGRALNRWIGDQPGRRDELFVVTKLPPGGNRPEHVEEYFSASLQRLGLEYVDMYMLHVPFAFVHVPGDFHPKNPDGTMMVDCSTDLIAVWKELQKLKASGRARFVGVCNVNPDQLRRLNAVAKPDCLQVEVHIVHHNLAVRNAARELGIPVVAYSPLGSRVMAQELAKKARRDYPVLMELGDVRWVAESVGRTPAQVLLRYLLQRGLAVIPKSTNPERIKENISVWDFELGPEYMATMDKCDCGPEGRICDFSFFPGVEKHPEFPFNDLFVKPSSSR